jgi:polyhydroxybutyrate depolymerase
MLGALLLLGACVAVVAGRGLREGERSLEIQGETRSYYVHVPPAAAAGKPLAVVFVLHGGGGSARHARAQTGFDAVADREGFLVVYPNGSGRFGERLLTWNAGSCCEYAAKQNVDDVAFFRAMVNALQKEHAIDPKRVYATGMSNGAMMSYRLACEMSDVFAAVAPVAGVQVAPSCEPREPVSVMHVHGSADENVLLQGGVGASAFAKDVRPPVAPAIQRWARHDGCAATPTITREGAVETSRHAPCTAGAEVVFHLVHGGGHAWPGSQLKAPPERSTEMPATEVIWSFFAQHPKP